MTWEAPLAVPTIEQMVAMADETVAGLEKAKRWLAMTLRRHMLAAFHDRPYRLPASMVLGATGGGKTHLVRAMVEAAGVPYVEVNATQYSEVGYFGKDLVSIFTGFWSPQWLTGNRRRDIVPLAERWGVVIFDEVDKWRSVYKPGERQTGRALQAELLHMIEGEDVLAKEKDGETGTLFRTHHLLWIGLGAFDGIDTVVARSMGQRESFNAYLQTQAQHLVEYGFMPEFVGRFSTILPLPPLDDPAVMRILSEQIWPSYEQQAADEGFTLHADESALRSIANQATLEHTGARALGPIIDGYLRERWIVAKPGERLVLTLDQTSGGVVLRAA